MTDKKIKKMGGIGCQKQKTDEYIAIYFPDHPSSASDGYIMEHKLVAEALLGRALADDECVHHINGIRYDNRKENLQVMKDKDHRSYHMKERWRKKYEQGNLNGTINCRCGVEKDF